MSADDTGLSGRAAELRQAFDAAFVAPRDAGPAAVDDYLAIRVADHSYLLRLRDIAGVHADKVCTPLPGPVAELRGLAAIRGTMLPVYDLARLLSYPAADEPRWLAVSAEAPVAFAFAVSEGHIRCRSDAVATARDTGARQHVREVVRDGALDRPIINLPSLVAALRKRPDLPAKKEP